MRSLVPVISVAIFSFSAAAVPQTAPVNSLAKSSFLQTGECFTLKTYAPEGKPPSQAKGLIQKQYVPQPFVLRSTCATIARMELLPSSSHRHRAVVNLGKQFR